MTTDNLQKRLDDVKAAHDAVLYSGAVYGHHTGIIKTTVYLVECKCGLHWLSEDRREAEGKYQNHVRILQREAYLNEVGIEEART